MSGIILLFSAIFFKSSVGAIAGIFEKKTKMDSNYRRDRGHGGGGGHHYNQKRKQPEDDSGIATIVANHYNSINNKDISERAKSRIYHMRNFNNWIKSIIIRKGIFV